MITVHFVRHGQSTWNVQGRLQGQTAYPELTDVGLQQARMAARVVRAAVGADVQLWSSDLIRAWRTAEVIAGELDVAVRDSAALREQGLGALEGRLRHELVAEPTPVGLDISEVRWGGGESVQDVYDRIGAFLAGLPEGEHVLVSHGDTIRIGLAVLDGRGHRDVVWDDIPNGAVVSRTIVQPADR